MIDRVINQILVLMFLFLLQQFSVIVHYYLCAGYIIYTYQINEEKAPKSNPLLYFVFTEICLVCICKVNVSVEAQSQGLKGTGTITWTPVQTNATQCNNPEMKTTWGLNGHVHFLLTMSTKSFSFFCSDCVIYTQSEQMEQI